LIPGVKLEYIPKRERDVNNWIDDKEYLDPKLGSLFWCHGGAPKTKSAIANTRMYVIGDQVGATVDAVAKAAKNRPRKTDAWSWVAEEEVRKRVAAVLKEERSRPAGGFWGPMNHVTADQVYNMIVDREFSKENFELWVDIQPWMNPSRTKVESMTDGLESMSVEPTTADVVKHGPLTTTKWTEGEVINVEDWEYWENGPGKEKKAEELEEAMMSEMVPLLS
jgi:hypothetical protein